MGLGCGEYIPDIPEDQKTTKDLHPGLRPTTMTGWREGERGRTRKSYGIWVGFDRRHFAGLGTQRMTDEYNGLQL